MFGLRNRFERFCFKHRTKGIPNLMLYISFASAAVFFLGMVNGGSVVYQALCFDKTLILQGQVWRLITFIFTYNTSSFIGLIGLYFFYLLSRHVEAAMGTFRFNLFYFSGVILMDVFAMIFCPTEPVFIGSYVLPPEFFTSVYSDMAYYLHLTMILYFAALNPDAQFSIFFIIPVKAWLLSFVYLVLVLIDIVNMTLPADLPVNSLFPHNLFPLVGLANFLLFAGRDMLNLLPPSLRPKGIRVKIPKPAKAKKQADGPIPFHQEKKAPTKAAYMHRCTICGKTDVSDPDLEFRYCSRCNGYFCYCQDHISNHTHVE